MKQTQDDTRQRTTAPSHADDLPIILEWYHPLRNFPATAKRPNCDRRACKEQEGRGNPVPATFTGASYEDRAYAMKMLEAAGSLASILLPTVEDALCARTHREQEQGNYHVYDSLACCSYHLTNLITDFIKTPFRADVAAIVRRVEQEPRLSLVLYHWQSKPDVGYVALVKEHINSPQAFVEMMKSEPDVPSIDLSSGRRA